MKKIVNEGSAGTLDITFYDNNGVAMVPATAYYKITDFETNTEIRGYTQITPLNTTVTITMLPEDNAIINNSLSHEKKIVTIKTNEIFNDAEIDEFEYWVKNLHYYG